MAACGLGDQVSPWEDSAIQRIWPDTSLEWIYLYTSCSLVLHSPDLWLLILPVEVSIRVHIVTIFREDGHFELACKLLVKRNVRAISANHGKSALPTRSSR
jgi:hypothetical protein